MIVDAPATGHALGALRTPRTFAEIARVGPIANQGRTIDATLRDPAQTAVVAVALPEEMPVTETLALRRRLREALGLELAAVVVNACLPERLGPRQAKTVAERARGARDAGRRTRRCARRCPSTRARARSASRSRGSPTEIGEQPPLELPYLFAPTRSTRPRSASSPTGWRGCCDRRRATLLAGTRVCVVGGSGGVGKTTTSAAIAAGMAARGLKVAVVTIDPAQRLATALGLDELGNEPHRIDPRALRRRRPAARRRRAVGDDARPEAHVRRSDRARSRPTTPHARADPRQPRLPRAVGRDRRLAGVHRGREAPRAGAGGRLGPARARHAAEPQRARLPRRARPPRARSSRAARCRRCCAAAAPGCGCSAAAPGSCSGCCGA